MRWEKGKSVIQIESARKSGVAVWLACAYDENGQPMDLPDKIEFRETVPQTDADGLATLKKAISLWASRNGYSRAIG
jgi:hypothetical protein